LGEKGFWDVGELEAEFKDLIIADAPIEIAGFGADEIDQIVSGGNANLRLYPVRLPSQRNLEP
jgi:hypothetical protein